MTIFLTDDSMTYKRILAHGHALSGFRFVTVRHSYNYLISLEARVTRDQAWFNANGIVLTWWGPIEATNSLTIGVENLNADDRSKILARYGADAISVVEGGPLHKLAVARNNDSPPWNGGDFTWSHTTDYRGIEVNQNCTSGPGVHDAGGNKYLLSDAHCFYVGEGVHNYSSIAGGNTNNIGTIQYRNGQDGGIDDELITTYGGSSNLNWVDDSTTRYPQIGGASDYVGDSVCTSGAYELQVCALTVTAVNFCATGLDPVRNQYVLSCALNEATRNGTIVVGAGDSGGPVYNTTQSGDYIRGIIQGAAGTAQACLRYPNRGQVCTSTVDYTDIHTVLTGLHVSLN